MAKYYIISDGDFREEYPMFSNLDMNQFSAVVRIEQRTTLRDTIGDNLYNHLEENIFPALATSLSPDETTLLEKCQYFMIFLVAKSLEDFSKTSGNDRRADAARNKATFLKTKLKEFINDSTELSAIVDGDTEPQRTNYQFNPTYFYR